MSIRRNENAEESAFCVEAINTIHAAVRRATTSYVDTCNDVFDRKSFASCSFDELKKSSTYSKFEKVELVFDEDRPVGEQHYIRITEREEDDMYINVYPSKFIDVNPMLNELYVEKNDHIGFLRLLNRVRYVIYTSVGISRK